MSANEFVETIIAQQIKPSFVVVGEDFRFGENRAGDIKLLAELGNQYNFKLEAVSAIELSDSRISSGRVRELISAGNFTEVENLLGESYFFSGKVVAGESLGSKLGYPTANLKTCGRVSPKRGVYLSKCTLGGEILNSITNVGVRPTFSGEELLVETHILEFPNLNLHGKELGVRFLKYLRDEIKFSSREELIQQISKDVSLARELHGISN